MNASHTLIAYTEVELSAALCCKPALQGHYFHSSFNAVIDAAQVDGANAFDQRCSNIISFKV